jgi:hypothetical protein
MSIDLKRLVKLLLILVLVFPHYPYVINAEVGEGTVVGGFLNEDTTWTKEGSPYRLIGNVTIPKNVMLTIEPGVSVVGKIGVWIQTSGKLVAIGGETEGERINFNTAYIQSTSLPETYVHLENANLTHGFNGGFLVTGANLYLKNNRFSNGSISVSRPKTIEPLISGNLFQQNATVDVWLGSKNTKVTNNTFLNITGDAKLPDISIGCSLDCQSPNLELSGNNFFGLDHPFIKFQSDKLLTFDGANNYWGTTDITKANRFIIDASDNPNFRALLKIDPITYKPFNHGHPFGELTVPFVHSVGDDHQVVTGLTDADSKIEVWDATEKIGAGFSIQNGTFSVDIPNQRVGTELTIFVTDSYNRISEPLTTIVLDTTPPKAPIVDEVTDAIDYVSGKAEPGVKITVMATGKVIAIGNADQDGQFKIRSGTLSADSTIEVQAEDDAGNKSLVVTVTVRDVTPPAKPQLIEEFTDAVNFISGLAEPGSTVVVTSGSTELLRQAAKSNGKFGNYIQPQKSGEIIKIVAIDKSGNKSEPLIVEVKDVTPPSLYVYRFGDSNEYLYGVSEMGAEIYVLKDGLLIGTTIVVGDQDFKVEIPRQLAGTKLSVISKDNAGNETKTEIVVEDVTPPTKPVVDIVTDKSNVVTGEAEALTTVQVQIGTSVVGTVQTDINGLFSIKIPIQVAGTIIKITAKDAAGNISASTNVTVKDVTPPAVPQVNRVTNKTSTISGKTEKAATITVKIGTKTYSGKADEFGSYKLSIPIQNAGTVISVTAKDVAGNTSATRTVTVTRVAPNVPVVNTVNNKATSVSGKTEKNATVSVKIGTKTYSSKADVKGNFKVSIPIQNAETTLSITAKDSSGAVSYARKVKVVKVAPNIPVVNPVRYYSTTVTGKAEKSSSVTAKIGTKVYSAKANANGSFTIYIPKQRKETLINVTAKNSKGNISATRQVKVY